MISQERALQVIDGRSTTNTTIYGLATDEKPTDVGNGSCFIEMDTSTLWFFDAESGDWLEWGGE